jgi:CheY-like chemotaxis protein
MEEHTSSVSSEGVAREENAFAEAAARAVRLGELARGAAEESMRVTEGRHPLVSQSGEKSVQHKILLVEDDPISARLIEYALTKHGYGVTTASNGMAGLRFVHEGNPDLVVLDIMLPGIDGFDVLSRLRSKGHDMPVVMCSGLAGEDDRKTAVQLGADEYLVKPVSPSAVIDAVEKLLGQGRKGHTAVVEEAHG